jgi:hypothetical protein
MDIPNFRPVFPPCVVAPLPPSSLCSCLPYSFGWSQQLEQLLARAIVLPCNRATRLCFFLRSRVDPPPHTHTHAHVPPICRRESGASRKPYAFPYRLLGARLPRGSGGIRRGWLVVGVVLQGRIDTSHHRSLHEVPRHDVRARPSGPQFKRRRLCYVVGSHQRVRYSARFSTCT